MSGKGIWEGHGFKFGRNGGNSRPIAKGGIEFIPMQEGVVKRLMDLPVLVKNIAFFKLPIYLLERNVN